MDGALQGVQQNINASGLGIQNIRSGVGTVAVYVRFFNLTGTDVDVIWINEEGRGIRYGQLKKSQYLDINTYEGHPWIFRESGVGDLLVGQPGRITRVIQNLLVHRLQYVSMFEPNPLVGRRLRATVRRYMNPTPALPAQQPLFGDNAHYAHDQDHADDVEENQEN
ncbi:unnamed protein product [Strongylus vulgaris]|uniref:von Hippel-Lindau disease tumour suppressor beta domain-containing protein n=1 Tax=Strongylus vulgaris TaxID=40348 RepID=A0A3P7JYI2_STRVU|nr:unnamed protein product [Strongylus vulgaris]